jgi:hypothetical protein
MFVKKAVAKRGAKAEKLGRNSTPAGDVVATSRSIKKKGQRPHGVTLADLFLWVTVVDECQIHPMGAFERAAVTEKLQSPGNIQQRLKALESRFGILFQPLHKRGTSRKGAKIKSWKKYELRPSTSRTRSGVPNGYGTALAEIFATIEHLYHYALSLKGSSDSANVSKIKNAVFSLVPSETQRDFDRATLEDGALGNRIWRTDWWIRRLREREWTGEPRKLSALTPRRVKRKCPK